MEIRQAVPGDLELIAGLEAQCFPPAEAADWETVRGRLAVYPHHFYLLFDRDTLAGFICGMVSDEPDLRDEMYENPDLHREDGAWQMIFGVDTAPAYRRQGCAGRLIRHMAHEAREQGRKGLVLTCKERLLPYYAKFGFQSEGLSASVHGDAVWYQMRLSF